MGSSRVLPTLPTSAAATADVEGPALMEHHNGVPCQGLAAPRTPSRQPHPAEGTPTGRWLALATGEPLWDETARDLHALAEGQEWSAAMSPDDADRLLDAVDRVSRSGRPECLHYRLVGHSATHLHGRAMTHQHAAAGSHGQVWMCASLTAVPGPRSAPDVTSFTHAQPSPTAVRRWRVCGTVQRVGEVACRADEQTRSAARMARLVHLARLLGQTESEQDVLDVIGGPGAAALGAAGVVFCFAEPQRPVVRTISTSYFGEQVRAEVAEVPDDFPLPMISTARSGQPHFFPDRASAVAAFPGGADLYERSATFASAVVPLQARGMTFGSLAVGFAEDHPWPQAERDLLDAFAALTAQALDRLRARAAERAAAASAQRMVETLRRALVPDLPRWAGLQVAVRYQPASGPVQLGGDWYDAFSTRDGDLALVVGDVAGHDRVAAAGMAQMRNLLRGVAQSMDSGPAQVLSTLDGALGALDIDVLATVLLCRLHRLDADTWQLRWTNAGHPPPVLVQPDGSVQLLERDSDVLLGIGSSNGRSDHLATLRTATRLVLYTDGLVERRHESLEDGTARLLQAVSAVVTAPAEAAGGPLDPDGLCEHLMSVLGVDGGDDVTVVVIELG